MIKATLEDCSSGVAFLFFTCVRKYLFCVAKYTNGAMIVIERNENKEIKTR